MTDTNPTQPAAGGTDFPRSGRPIAPCVLCGHERAVAPVHAPVCQPCRDRGNPVQQLVSVRNERDALAAENEKLRQQLDVQETQLLQWFVPSEIKRAIQRKRNYEMAQTKEREQ